MCDTEKPLDDYYYDRGRDRYRSNCKECMKKRNREHARGIPAPGITKYAGPGVNMATEQGMEKFFEREAVKTHSVRTRLTDELLDRLQRDYFITVEDGDLVIKHRSVDHGE